MILYCAATAPRARGRGVDKLANAFEEMLKDPSIQKYADDNGANLMIGIKKDAFRDCLKDLNAGETVVLQIERDGKTEEANVTLTPVSSPLASGNIAQRAVFGIGTAVRFLRQA